MLCERPVYAGQQFTGWISHQLLVSPAAKAMQLYRSLGGPAMRIHRRGVRDRLRVVGTSS